MKRLAILSLAIFIAITSSGCSSGTQGIVKEAVQDAIQKSVDETESDYISLSTRQAMDEYIALTVNEAMNEAMNEIDYDSMQEIMSQAIREAMEDVDYDDFDLTKKQKIEIWSADEKQLHRVITDNHEIIDYIKNEHMEDWRFFSTIPENAEVIYKIVYWQDTTKTLVNPISKMIINCRDTLYKDSDGNYYIHTEVVDLNVEQMVAQIPEETGRFIIGVAEGNEILPVAVK